MTDTPTRVRFPCPEHDRWFRHPILPIEPGRRFVWCEGGTTKLLREATIVDAWLEYSSGSGTTVVLLEVTE